MNLLLLCNSDLTSHSSAVIREQSRVDHIRKIQGLKKGDSLKLGLINNLMGRGEITEVGSSEIHLNFVLDKTPPPPLPLTLILALPRPKMLRRILQALASLGVKKIYLINSYRVEKSYWQTPFLEASAIEAQLILGLEQACDTQMPEVRLAPLFKPFVEDELPSIIHNTKALVAHPYTETFCPYRINEPLSMAIGPEGGFIPYEISLLEKVGFESVKLGERIMRVETVVPFLIGRLF